MSEWNSMYSAPKDGRKFIIYHEKYGVAIVYRECGHWVSAQGYQEYHYGDAIGWMELPDPPKKKHYCICYTSICREDEEGRFWVEMGGLRSQIKYCPFCGEPAEKEHE